MPVGELGEITPDIMSQVAALPSHSVEGEGAWQRKGLSEGRETRGPDHGKRARGTCGHQGSCPQLPF